jgi:hypothetical protein
VRQKGGLPGPPPSSPPSRIPRCQGSLYRGSIFPRCGSGPNCSRHWGPPRACYRVPHAAFGWRIHCGVEVTELSTNKQLSLSHIVNRGTPSSPTATAAAECPGEEEPPSHVGGPCSPDFPKSPITVGPRNHPSKGLRDSEEERSEPQRFKFLFQRFGVAATQAAHLSTNSEQTLRQNDE